MPIILLSSAAFPVWGDLEHLSLLWSVQDHFVQKHPALEAAVWHSHPGTTTHWSWMYGTSWGASPPLSSPWIPRNGYRSRCASTRNCLRVPKRNSATNLHRIRTNKECTRHTELPLYVSRFHAFPYAEPQEVAGGAFSHKFGKKRLPKLHTANQLEKHKHIYWTLQLKTAPLKQFYGSSWTQRNTAGLSLPVHQALPGSFCVAVIL